MKMKSSNSKGSGLRKPCYDAGGLVAFRDEQNADGRADSYYELADPARVKKLAEGIDRTAESFKDGKIFSNMGDNFAAREQFIKNRTDPSFMAMNGMANGGVIGDVTNDKGKDTIDAKVRPGEYMLNPETVADHFGGGDHAMGVRNLNNIVRSATGKEPGAKMVKGKVGYTDSAEVKPLAGLRPGSPLAQAAYPDRTPKPVEVAQPAPPLGQARAGSPLAMASQNQLPAAPPPVVAKPQAQPVAAPAQAPAQAPVNTGMRTQPPVAPKAGYAGKDELGHHIYLDSKGQRMTNIFKGGDSHGLIQYDPSGMNPADPKELATAIALSGNASPDARKNAVDFLQVGAMDQHYRTAEELARAKAAAAGVKTKNADGLEEATKHYEQVTDKEGNPRFIENPIRSGMDRKSLNMLLRRNNIDPSKLNDEEAFSALAVVQPELDMFRNVQTGQINENLPVSDLPVSETGAHFTTGLRQRKASLLDPISANYEMGDWFGGGNTVVDAEGNILGTVSGTNTSLARQPGGSLSARGVSGLRGLPFLN